jgi:hypothetical protein
MVPWMFRTLIDDMNKGPYVEQNTAITFLPTSPLLIYLACTSMFHREESQTS